MNTQIKLGFTLALLLLGCVAQLSAQGTAFVYHGELSQRGRPARGEHDLRFTLYDATTNGNQIATQELPDVRVSDGEFSVTLDFGPGAFDGADRWLEISVKRRGGVFTALTPRQKIMPVPYAIMAGTASNLLGTLPASQIAGPIPTSQLSGPLPGGALSGTYSAPLNLDNAANQFTGDGSQLANVSAASLNGLNASNFWKLGGNAGTKAGVNFLGTTDDQALELKVNNLRALRIEPGSNGAPNIIGGAAENIVGRRILTGISNGILHYTSYPTGIYGATISGGGTTNATNIIASNFGSIGGGAGNVIESRALYSTISGGFWNQVPTVFLNAGAQYAFIGGGVSNRVHVHGGVIGGGVQNRIGTVNSFSEGEAGSTIGGGIRNSMDYETGGGSTIGGGIDNRLSGPGNTISGGISNKINRITSGTGHNSIGGGKVNSISSGTYAVSPTLQFGGYSIISGGYSNNITGSLAMVAGGMNNSANHFSFAAGRRAKATNEGAFAWADSRDVDFTSIASNSFSIRATGGTRFVSAIDTNGTPTAGVELPAGGGAWATLSDRDSKENFTPVDSREVLQRVNQMPISNWNYKSQDKTIRHIGPTAQDFAAAFQVGESERRITTVDADGVALAAIQGLSEIVNEKDEQIRKLQQRIERLEQFMNQAGGKQ